MQDERRAWLRLAGAGMGAAVMSTIATACGSPEHGAPSARGGGRLSPGGERGEHEEAQEVSPTEDLMQEHGLLERLMAVHEETARRLRSGESITPDAIREAASIERMFVHDYHERNEEQNIFARALSEPNLAPLVRTLLAQHQRGRELNAALTQLANAASLADGTRRANVIAICESLPKMYRPHAARENSVLFPASRALYSHHEWHALGEHFERDERRRFASMGAFEGIVARVADLERTLGIEDLARFTAPSIAAG